LIHSACGGVGITAIQIAQMVGAKVRTPPSPLTISPVLTYTLPQIFATVGSEEKVQFLIENFNIPRSQIFDSHSTSFLASVLEATNRRGVDIALNSLAGELLHATWQCVAPFGTMMGTQISKFIIHKSWEDLD
jgi:NADPH:quinone reductase-like Zn-dependent oxidoreductase